MFRRPTLGVGKQRLARDIGTDAAREVGAALLDCALEDASDWPGPVVLAPADARDMTWAATLLAREARVMPQSSGNLGERLNHVDAALRLAGQQQLMFIGSDAPAHPPQLYAQAAAGLTAADVVLVPAADGGVTLMAARVAWPPLVDLPWSEPTLGSALARRCREHPLQVTSISASFDIDNVTSCTTRHVN